MRLLIAALCGFLLGSFPSGYLLARSRRGEDIREIGSGSTGATNVLRGGGAALAAATLAADAAKGVAAVLVARALRGPDGTEGVAALAAVAGHMFPPWLAFRGGKGVATAAGGFAVAAPFPCAAALGVFAAVTAWVRIVSVGSVAAAASLPFWAAWLGAGAGTIWPAAGIAALILWGHRENVARVLDGSEPRIGRGGRAGGARG